ncbi:MAG: type II secretion system protein M [Oscillospiraceae bacterium]|nr:type II secretion system protein M [Oscillospiraceae bacterium]
MKILSRDFTIKERVLILLLCLLLLGLVYYQFVDQPVRQAIANANAEKEALQVELTAVNAKLDKLREMQEEIDRLGDLSDVSVMCSYNNSKAEVDMLNDILASANEFKLTLDPGGVTRSDNQIRRAFSLEFKVYSFQQVYAILQQLADSPYRCLINEVRYTFNKGNERKLSDITVNVTGTFYETMVGGTADAGLPKDEKAAS